MMICNIIFFGRKCIARKVSHRLMPHVEETDAELPRCLQQEVANQDHLLHNHWFQKKLIKGPFTLTEEAKEGWSLSLSGPIGNWGI